MALRRRVKRDLTLIAGVVVILCVVVALNYGTGLSKAIAKFDAMRTAEEDKQAQTGVDLLSWKLMRATKGTLRSGGQFDPELVAKDNTPVNLVGFMVPLEQFNHVTEFLFLPLPLECYFCQIPPARDVMLVKLKPGSETKLWDEPVLCSGTIKLDSKPGAMFFYTLENAEVGKGVTVRDIKQEHTVIGHEPTAELQKGYEPATAQ